MALTICVDFGSTFTKFCVLDLDSGELVMTDKHPTTVASDASIALLAGLEEVKRYVGEKAAAESKIVASSSAAGGLRMVVVGLTRQFSLTAGKNVALGAGARVIKAYENYLTKEDVLEIEKINPEILLLCGGVEGGNTERILFNTEMLKKANISSHVVYAGNREISPLVRKEFLRYAIPCYTTDNVFPEWGKLNAAPAGEVIRRLFMERIVGAKGLASVFPVIGSVLMPTPAAVLAGGRLLSQGTGNGSGLGDLMIFDVGGATTDVYSYSDVSSRRMKHAGAPESFSKRTVEGDLGVRSSCLSLTEAMGRKLRDTDVGLTEDELRVSCQKRYEESAYVPDSLPQQKLEQRLAEGAVEISARRHCGRVINVYAKKAVKIVEGKDLRDVSCIVGTGGPIVFSRDPLRVLRQALSRNCEQGILLPEAADFYLDKSYLLYAIGLCCGSSPEGALQIAKQNIVRIS